MKKYIVVLLLPFLFSGCTIVTQQALEKSKQEKVKLKKAVVKLIKKNSEVDKTIKAQELKTKEMNLKIIFLENEMKQMNKQLQMIEKEKTIKAEKKEEIEEIEELNRENKQQDIVLLNQNNLDNKFYVQVIKEQVNLRVEPLPESFIYGLAHKGDIFEVMDKSNGEFMWYKVFYKDKPVWIYSETVEKVNNTRGDEK